MTSPLGPEIKAMVDNSNVSVTNLEGQNPSPPKNERNSCLNYIGKSITALKDKTRNALSKGVDSCTEASCNCLSSCCEKTADFVNANISCVGNCCVAACFFTLESLAISYAVICKSAESSSDVGFMCGDHPDTAGDGYVAVAVLLPAAAVCMVCRAILCKK